MDNTITITSKKGPLDLATRKQSLQWLQDHAETAELTKLVKLAKNPAKRAFLKSL